MSDMGFTKLFSSIVNSTVWREEMHVKVVWVTMLALANRHGEVLASIPGLADASRVSLDQCLDALARLKAPDVWSRTKEFEGRRIIDVDGGWRILTYEKHRAIRDADERRIQTREAVQRYRAKKADSLTVSTVSQDKPRKPKKAQAEAEAEAEAETAKSTTLVAPTGTTAEDLITELRTLSQQQHSNGATRGAKVKLIFAYWAAKWDHPQTRLDAKRNALVARRLQENHDNVSELLFVVDGSKRDSWAERPRFAGVEQLFKDRGAVEKFAALCPEYGEGLVHPMAAKYGLSDVVE